MGKNKSVPFGFGASADMIQDPVRGGKSLKRASSSAFILSFRTHVPLALHKLSFAPPHDEGWYCAQVTIGRCYTLTHFKWLLHDSHWLFWRRPHPNARTASTNHLLRELFYCSYSWGMINLYKQKLFILFITLLYFGVFQVLMWNLDLPEHSLRDHRSFWLASTRFILPERSIKRNFRSEPSRNALAAPQPHNKGRRGNQLRNALRPDGPCLEHQKLQVLGGRTTTERGTRADQKNEIVSLWSSCGVQLFIKNE